MICSHCNHELVGPLCPKCNPLPVRAWPFILTGAIGMYLFAGILVTWSLAVHTHGPCPWWLYPSWVIAWLPMVVDAGLHA